MWNRNARRDNIHKQRMKILVHELGEEEIRARSRRSSSASSDGAMTLPRGRIDRIAAYFAPPPFERRASASEIDRLSSDDPDFALWVDRQVAPHKAPGYAIVNISLKPIGGIPGDITAEQMDARRRPRRALQLRRAARHPRAEPGPAARPQAGPLRGVDARSTTRASARPTSTSSPTSSPARGSTTAASPTRARSRSRRSSPSASPTPRASRTSAS